MATRRAAPKVARGSTTPLLTRALAALDAGDHATAITELAAAWARRRSPVLADWVDLLDAQQAERPFAELLATKVETTVNRLLSASSDDPRLSSVLLDLLEHPRFLTDRAFWDLVLDRVAACADVRLRDALPAIRSTLIARITPVATRDHVVSRLDAVAKAIKTPRAPSDKDAELERAIAQRLSGGIAQSQFEKTWMRTELGACANLPALRTLTMLFDGGLRVEHVAWALTEATVVPRLDRLVLGGGVSQTPELDRLNFEAILSALPTMQAPVRSLGIIPSWRSWPRPAPIELVRADGGAYQRV